MAAKADERSALISARSQDRHAKSQESLIRAAEIVGVLPQCRQEFRRKGLGHNPPVQIIVLFEPVGARRGGVGRGGDMWTLFGEMPQQPCVDSAEQQPPRIPRRGDGGRFFNMPGGPQVEGAGAGRPARRRHQPCVPIRREGSHFFCVARILPDHRGDERLSRPAVPEHAGRALRRERQRDDLDTVPPRLFNGRTGDRQGSIQKRIGVLLDDAVSW